MILALLLLLATGPTAPVAQYRATVVRVIDGDTYELQIDLGYRVTTTQAIRLYGWDCPELPTPEGKATAASAAALLAAAHTVIVENTGIQSFARWVGKVWIDGRDLGYALAPACRPFLKGHHL